MISPSLSSVVSGSLPAMPTRCLIYLSGGVWYAQEQVRCTDGSHKNYGAPIALESVSTPGSDVSLSGTSVTLKSGLAAQNLPHQATIQWRLALSSLVGLALAIGKQHVVTITADAIPPSTINGYLGVVLAAPSGAYDANTETISAVSLGRGNTNLPSTRYAVTTNVWANLIADATIVASQMAYEEGSAQSDIRALAAGSVVQKTHQTTNTTTATHLYLLGFVQTANLLADATFTNPTVVISYGDA